MKRSNRICIWLIMMLVCVLTACTEKPDFTDMGMVSPTITAAGTSSMGGEEGQKPTVAPLKTYEIQIYSINPDTMTKEAVTALVLADSALTPELILEQVTDAMEDEAFYLDIREVTVEEKSIIVSFGKGAPPVENVGASVEAEILDAIGQSLLDNLPDYSKVIFRIEGGAYETGHITLGINEAYISR